MDVIDILGGLLGNKSSGSGTGAKILKDILKRGLQPKAEPRPTPAPRTSPTARRPSASAGHGDIEQQAQELEDLLAVANDRHTRRAPTQSQPTTQPQSRPRSSPPAPRPIPRSEPSRPISTSEVSPTANDRQGEQALVLIRAMINAAKSDGQISQTEQQNILRQVGDASAETIAFLRTEFAKPLDAREFAWSVPPGMEQQVYTISLMAIDLDSGREASYLRDLAHGLRLAPEVCEQIHRRLGAPAIR